MTNIRVIEKFGSKPGKTVVILAGVHGNEVCGINAFNSLIPKIKIDFGRVFFIYANLEAIRENKRCVEKNLNRCFFREQEQEIGESLEGKTAKEIIPFLDKADVMLDVHASFIPDSKPFVICDKSMLSQASIFEADLASYNWDQFHSGSTDYYMNLRGKPGFCYECGYLGDKASSEKAEKAISEFLIWSGNCTGEIKMNKIKKVIRIKSIYKNNKAPFKMAGYFPDFAFLGNKTLIGKEGETGVYGEKGDILLFVRDCRNLNEECFLTAREATKRLLTNKSQLNLKEGKK